jgi:hypothetical protein
LSVGSKKPTQARVLAARSQNQRPALDALLGEEETETRNQARKMGHSPRPREEKPNRIRELIGAICRRTGAILLGPRSTHCAGIKQKPSEAGAAQESAAKMTRENDRARGPRRKNRCLIDRTGTGAARQESTVTPSLSEKDSALATRRSQ